MTGANSTNGVHSPHHSDRLIARLHKDGYVVVRSSEAQLIPDGQYQSLLTASAEIATSTRNGKWPFLRTMPKQFPPWDTDASAGVWGVQHLLHPDCPHRDEFANLYFGPAVLSVVREILGVESSDSDKELVMELFNMLIAPPRDFQLRWHRDGISFDDLSVDAEAQAMSLPYNEDEYPVHTQYNIPLYADESLHVVPGSHRRPRTKEECALLDENSYSPELPGMIKVELQPGDIVFYDSNIIHRGFYRAEMPRLTLHGSVSRVSSIEAESRQRARQVLQHGVKEWIDRPETSFVGVLNDADTAKIAELMRIRLIELGGISNASLPLHVD